MQLISHPVFLEHDTGNHPENRRRLECLTGLQFPVIPFNEEDILLVHDHAYLEHVKRVALQGGGVLDPDTVLSSKSYEAAVYAAGAAVLASQQNDFAVVRPPGHHAYPAKAGGFCLFNNVAVAVAKLVQAGHRVMIFDFDGHCGDGTEEIFYDSPKVLYWSFHQSPAFPFKGSEDEIGTGKGKGYTINVPLPPGSGDDIFFKGMEHLMPVAGQFRPDVVAVSAGFDAHQSDPLLDLGLSTGAYYRIGAALRRAFPRVFAVLEGGYNTEELPKCVTNFVDGINGRPQRFEEPATTSSYQTFEEFDIRMGELDGHLSPFWEF